jgi:hypothetical protein
MEDKKMKTKLLIILTMILALSTIVSAGFCEYKGVIYYGFCSKDGDVVVYDSQDNVVGESLYSLNSGCYNGLYALVLNGGSSPGCILQEGEEIVFYVSGSLAGVTKWYSSDLNKDFDLTTDRSYIFVENDNVTISDEQNIDVTEYGTPSGGAGSGGGSGNGGGSSVLFASMETDSGNIDVAKFTMPVDSDKSVDIQSPASGEIYLNVSDAEDVELFVLALKESGAVEICIGSQSFEDCEQTLKLQMGESKSDIFLESDYMERDGKKYYVIKGLKNGVAKESSTLFSIFLIFAGIIAALSLLIVYVVAHKK